MRRLAAILGILLSIVAAAPAARADDDTPRIMLVLDASTSMADDDAAGTSKLGAVKKALTAALDSIPDEAEVGLRVYGATQDENTPAACEDSQVVHPVERLNRDALRGRLDEISPKGGSPIAYSLQEAAKDLGEGGKRHIILVSDGADSCAPDPCADLRALLAEPGVQLDVVGLGVDAAARAELSCLARAGGGTYHDVVDGEGLRASLSLLGARTARPFTVSGTPVTGGTDAASAPELTAGQYTDVSHASSVADQAQFYRIKRTWPGSTLRVNVAIRHPPADHLEASEDGHWEFRLQTVTGEECAEHVEYSLGGGDAGTVSSTTTVALPLDPLETDPDEQAIACAADNELDFILTRGTGTVSDTPFELRVIEEPPVENAADLPSGIKTVPRSTSEQLDSPASGTPVEVVGGAGFNDAANLDPGTYSAQVMPGEVVFFKTHIDYGQSAVFSLDGIEVGERAKEVADWGTYLPVTSDVYAPDFSQMDSNEISSSSFEVDRDGVNEPDKSDRNEVPQVRYRNRWDSPAMFSGTSQGFSMAGFYYYAVGVGTNDTLLGQPVQVRFSFAVTGEVTGQPVSTVSPAPALDQHSGRGAALPAWLYYGAGGGLLLLGLAGIVVVLWRRGHGAT